MSSLGNQWQFNFHQSYNMRLCPGFQDISKFLQGIVFGFLFSFFQMTPLVDGFQIKEKSFKNQWRKAKKV